MKNHIFIGSTLDDLKNERRDIPRIIMELGQIPVSAEYLDSSEKNYNKLLEKTIEDCDFFIAIAAFKYAQKGEKTSSLEQEYNIALKKDIPVISLIIDNKARWKASKKEKESALIRKMDELKKKLCLGPHETWLSSADLNQKMRNLLIMQMNVTPKSGWVRADRAVSPMVANELARLSAENEQLKKQIKIEGGEIAAQLREQMKNALKVLALNNVTLSFYYMSGENWENSRKFRYLKIFILLTPELSVGKTTAEVSRFMGTVLNPDLEKTVRRDYPVPSNSVKKIMADFSMLKIVRCINEISAETPENKMTDEIWEITEYGKELYSAYRMKQLENAVENPEDEE
ncbi:MAG: DUF4062 domain-containing protein [Treponema sp.]|nr:DUF4062 domain-containing protein [Treponema sp.]